MGKTWSPGVKVNDDTTHTWQRDAFPALDAQAYIYVAWTDYRDKGASGDITPNIYFARSEDDGKSWSQNVRISYARYGGDLYPRLSLVSDGTLNCTWMNSEDNLLFDIFFSNSHDGGRTWSQPTRVNDDPERVQHVHRPIGWLGPDLKGNIAVGWLDWREGQPAVYMAQLLDHPDTARPERKPQRTVAASEVKPAFVMESGEMLFQDDFADAPSPQWEVQSGIWVSKDQTYIGYGAYEARSFVGSESWNDYVFQGRFKLDPIEHLAAYLYFRAMINDERYPRYYRITNFFRRGVTLEYFDGKSLHPLVDAAYPFQKTNGIHSVL